MKPQPLIAAMTGMTAYPLSTVYARTRACMHTPEKGKAVIAVIGGADGADATALADLLTAADRACDFHGDNEQAREQMRRECMETPPHLRADLLAHFQSTYGDRK